MQIDLQQLLETVAFKNNQNLRPCGVNIPYSEYEVKEIMKCMKDPIYFIENYVKVVHPDRGIVNMTLYDYQKRLVNAYHKNRKVVGMTSRQLGKTTTAAAYIVWFMNFTEDKTSAILANKQAQAFEIMDRIRFAYENLPKWMQQGIKRWNRGSIELENGSKCFGAATSKSAIRGRSVQCMLLDEFAFVENNQAEEFFTSVFPTLSASVESKLIITSTPCGYNHFYKIWNEAEKGLNGFVPIKCLWHEHPERDQTWYNEQRLVLGELKTAQELDTEFLGSAKQLLTASTLARLSASTPIKEYADDYRGLRLYESPKEGGSYVITVDVSRGRHLDDSAFVIYNVTTQPFTIAAVYNNNEISPLMYANLINKTGKNYNNAYLLIEINDIGSEVANSLYYDFEYENMFWTKSGDQLGKRGTDPYPGIRTTKKTKRIGCAHIKDLIEKNNLLVNDLVMISQFSTFVQSDGGSYQADEGFKDDVVMCGVLFGWLANQPWFKDLTDQDMRLKMYEESISRMEEELVPFGFISKPTDYLEEHSASLNSKEAMEFLL